jgi:hypothetical protein
VKSLLFFLGSVLIAIAMGTPDNMQGHSGSAKSALPYLFYWLLEPITNSGGKHLVALVGAGMLVLALLLPTKPKPKDR